jgi:hypothetical protein
VLKCDGSQFTNNRIYGPWGLTIKGGSKNKISHNTVYSTALYALNWQQQPTPSVVNSAGNIITDNIFVISAATGAVVKDEAYDHQNNRLDHNVYWATGGADLWSLNGNSYDANTTISAIQAVWLAWEETVALNGVTYGKAWSGNDAHSLVADPKLLNTTTFNVSSLSPAISAASDDSTIGAWQPNPRVFPKRRNYSY